MKNSDKRSPHTLALLGKGGERTYKGRGADRIYSVLFVLFYFAFLLVIIYYKAGEWGEVLIAKSCILHARLCR